MSYVNGYTPDSHSGSGSVTSLDSPSQSHSSGNTILVAVRSVNVSGSGSPVSVSSITDTAGNTYSRVGSPVTSESLDTTELWRAASESAEANNVVTVHWPSTTNYARMIVAQYGGDIGDAVDWDVTAEGSSTSSHSGGSVTTTADGALVVGFVFSFDGEPAPITGTGGTTTRAEDWTVVAGTAILDIEGAATGSHVVTASSAWGFQLLFFTAAFQASAGSAVTCSATVGAVASRQAAVSIYRSAVLVGSAQVRRAVAAVRAALQALHAVMWTGDAPIAVREFVRLASSPICRAVTRQSSIARTINLASPINLEDDSP